MVYPSQLEILKGLFYVEAVTLPDVAELPALSDGQCLNFCHPAAFVTF